MTENSAYFGRRAVLAFLAAGTGIRLWLWLLRRSLPPPLRPQDRLFFGRYFYIVGADALSSLFALYASAYDLPRFLDVGG